jgi:hypothetical protein
MDKIMTRNNTVQNRVIDAIVKHGNIKGTNKENSTVKTGKFENFKNIKMIYYARLKSELWYWLKLEEN